MEPTNRPGRVTLGLAGFVLVCFFLPWMQLSCAVVKDSASGLDLAADGDLYLWLVPLCMLVILALGFTRPVRERLPSMFALAGTVGGGFSAFLMLYERARLNNSSRLVATQWTAIFWLGLLACLGIVVAAMTYYGRRGRSP